MNLKECNAIIPDYRYLVGKKVKYKDELYKVIAIFSIPTGEVKVNIFIKLYKGQNQSASLALDRFMRDDDLTIVLECIKLSDDTIEFLSPLEVIVIE